MFLPFYPRTGHPGYNQVMKRPDQIEIDRSGPMFVIHNGKNIKPFCFAVEWLGDDAEICIEMFIFRRFRKPVKILFSASNNKESALVICEICVICGLKLLKNFHQLINQIAEVLDRLFNRFRRTHVDPGIQQLIQGKLAAPQL